ncbi:hypothetical protein DNTS_028695, partial [Danionella cerebrum]
KATTLVSALSHKVGPLFQLGSLISRTVTLVQVRWKPPPDQGALVSSQVLALPVRNRLDFMTRLNQLKKNTRITPHVTDHQNTSLGTSIERSILWRAILTRSPPLVPLHVTLEDSVKGFESPKQRDRRHVHSRGHHNHHHGQLMRVGCVLGTCQVQNLSHRLYQLVGQSGREDSPINPRSPHSYG